MPFYFCIDSFLDWPDKSDFYLIIDNGSNRPDPISEKPMSKAPEGEGCPRCGGHVYAAEQMLARGRVSLSIVYPLKKMNLKTKNGNNSIQVVAQEVLQMQGLP